MTDASSRGSAMHGTRIPLAIAAAALAWTLWLDAVCGLHLLY
jgi:hypothetical protein